MLCGRQMAFSMCWTGYTWKQLDKYKRIPGNFFNESTAQYLTSWTFSFVWLSAWNTNSKLSEPLLDLVKEMTLRVGSWWFLMVFDGSISWTQATTDDTYSFSKVKGLIFTVGPCLIWLSRRKLIFLVFLYSRIIY